MKQTIPINTMPDGTCRTLKATHANAAKFIRTDSFGATAVMEKHIIPINATKEGIAPCVTSHYYKAGLSDYIPRQSNEPTRHLAILEINEVALSNKEIEMEEPKPIQVAQIYDQEQNPINGRVYSEDGIAPTLRTPTGGLSEPKIMQIAPTVMENHGMPTAVLESPPIRIRQATAQGYVECPPGGGFNAACPNSKLRRGRVQDNGDVVGALTASADNHCVYEGVSILGYTRDDKGSIQNYHEREVAGTIHTSSGSGGNTDQFVRTRYRIRKLTPTECSRLQGVDDSDIDKLKSAKLTQTFKSGKVKEKPMPKTQLYKMAGNSICVDVLYHIFYQMFIAEPPKPKSIQKSLFD